MSQTPFNDSILTPDILNDLPCAPSRSELSDALIKTTIQMREITENLNKIFERELNARMTEYAKLTGQIHPDD